MNLGGVLCGVHIFRQSGSSVTGCGALYRMESVRRTVQTAYKSPALGPYSRSYGLGWARDPPEETQLLKVLCRLPVTDDERPEGVRV